MSFVFWLEVALLARVPPLVLFLVQYRGKPWAPIALMLRGCALIFLWQIIPNLDAYVKIQHVAPRVLQLTFFTNIAIAVWSWVFYMLYLKGR
jgi:hypothetical protein